MSVYKIAEKFISINGEGQRAGQPCAFIRLAGCNLRCSYCDTVWAQDGENCPCEGFAAEEIAEYISSAGVYCCTVTGGEPMLREGFDGLTKRLLAIKNLRTEIETNGSVFIGDLCDVLSEEERKNLSFTLDYKLPSSGMEKYMNMDNYKYLKSHDTVKFVCGDSSDLNRALEIIRQYDLSEKCPTYFSPVFGKIEYAEIVSFILENKLYNSRFQLQLHKFVWDPEMRGV